ncbi:hypothetical protein NEIRO02_0007 [Nematocida sp. AWRm79]|nr:hypothetical protein NEIRO02_0007 [Nematocida sp. AWRm79]
MELFKRAEESTRCAPKELEEYCYVHVTIGNLYKCPYRHKMIAE